MEDLLDRTDECSENSPKVGLLESKTYEKGF
nr:MAG TPA: hypothetical protein [Caudoviricetes sp.]DAT36270.1 MAG TPA: hypothetical protein [Caudoviricetes sp.]